MLEQLRLNNHAMATLIVSIITLFTTNNGFCIEDEHITIDYDRTTDRKHGLYEIREEARKFIDAQNSINHTAWILGYPSLKILVHRCAVPLKVKWVPESYGLSNTSVMVYCTKIANDPSPRKQWDVDIPVFSPEGSEENFDIRKAAIKLLKRIHSKQKAELPSTKYMVGKCLVPLDATMNKNKSAVNVTCKKPLQTFFFKGDSWTVPVPISR